jgi:hypothetical protein
MLKFIHDMRKAYGDETSKNMDRYFNTNKKIEICERGIDYIKECLHHNKFPKFSKINLGNKEIHDNKKFIFKMRHEITEQELKNKFKRKKSLNKDLKRLKRKIDDISTEHWTRLLSFVQEKVERIRYELNKKHKQKLRRLGVEPTYNIDDKFITKRGKKTSQELQEPIFNISSRALSEIEKRVLSKGLKFGIKPKRIDTYEILARFEELAQSLDKLEISDNNEEKANLKANLNSKSGFLQELQTLAFEFIELSKNAYDSFTDEEHRALEELTKDKTIIITKADKGNAVVIQDVDAYRNKIGELLNKDNKFNEIASDPTVIRERKLRDLINSMKDTPKNRNETNKKKKRKYFIQESTANRIQPCGSRAGLLYGLPKVHKSNYPLRPIISAINTYNYKLAKYLDEILKPFAQTNEHLLKDTFDFVNKVKCINTQTDRYMVSFDIESLFTNIPTQETIEIILNLVFEKNENFHGLEREDLKRLLTICTQESHFQFNGKFYDQVDGVSMGSPLGPLFANVFMNHFEKEHMTQLKELGIQVWLRYVDDIFATCSDKTQADNIMHFLNKQHPNIRFTTEYEEDNKLPFLDTCVIRGTEKYRTNIYHKKTFTGVYLNWKSLTSRQYKLKLIYCLMDRIWKICSLEEERNVEIEKLKQILLKNEYPSEIIEKEISTFIGRKTNPKPIQEKVNTRNTKKIIVLPYVNRKADHFSKRLRNLVENNFKDVKMNVAFTAPATIGQLFPFKDNIKKVESQALVVYKIKCKECDAQYIGKTERILSYRIEEHRKGGSACGQHEKETGHKMDFDNVEVIDRAASDFRLRIKELMHIIKLEPSLNKQLNSQSNFDIKTLIITAYPQHRK